MRSDLIGDLAPVNPNRSLPLLQLINCLSNLICLCNSGETKSYVSKLIRDHLGHEKVNANWVPTKLTAVQMKARVNTSKKILNDYRDRHEYLFDNLITVDETWVFYDPPQTPTSAAEWRLPGQDPPQLSRLQKNGKKVMATVF